MQSTLTDSSSTLASPAPALLTSAPHVAYWDRENDQEMVCTAVRQETHDVKTFTFRARDTRYFSFAAGQYFSFDFEIDGERVNRCYSVSSSALMPHAITITVKRVAGGTVSNWLHDHLQVGSVVQAMGPLGTFQLPAQTQDRFLFISGGAGITPVMSMLRTLADAQQHPDIVFFHAGRGLQDLVFEAELRLRARSTPNLRVFFLPEQVQPSDGHTGLSGRINAALLSLAVPDLAERKVLCCGPTPFMQAVRKLSGELGVPAGRYQEENFGAADAVSQATAAIAHAATAAPVAASVASPAVAYAPAAAPVAPAAPAPVAAPLAAEVACPAPVEQSPAVADAGQKTFVLHFAQQQKTLEVASNINLLGAMRQAGLHIPSSCGEGLCGTCKTKLVSGQVDMVHNGGIRQREIQAGFFLPCCSTPLTDLVVDR